MGAKISKNKIYERLTNLFPKYFFDLTDYENTTSKIDVICEQNHSSKRIVKNILKGHGCSKCGNIKSGTKQRKSIKTILNKFHEVHNQKYDYTKFNYENIKIASTIICFIHGEFEQSFQVHIKGHGCPSCSNNKKLNSTEFIKKSKQVHSQKYDYGLILYINMHTKVKILCKTHGIFEQIPMNHIRGIGCPKCNQSKGEKIIENVLKNNNINYNTQVKFEKCKYKKQLLFDFYLPNHNICIEFNGIQHYSPIEIFGGLEEFEKIKIRDKIKLNFCNKNKIKLVIIKELNVEKITDEIEKILNKK